MRGGEQKIKRIYSTHRRKGVPSTVVVLILILILKEKNNKLGSSYLFDLVIYFNGDLHLSYVFKKQSVYPLKNRYY